MKTLSKQQNARVPSWALSYLINGDYSGITEDEKTTVDKWLDGMNKWVESIGGNPLYMNINPVTEHEFFTKYPEFGLPCDCTECDIEVLY